MTAASHNLLIRVKNIALTVVMMLFTANSWALRSDSQQPANFTADQFQTNQKTGVTVFIGHVQMTQGSTQLTADQVTVYHDNHNKIHKVVAIGVPAHYATLPDDQKKQPPRVMDAYGKTIEYYPQLRKAVILGDGLVIQGPNRLNGEHIIYDMDKQLVTSLPTKPDVQSVIVLQPQDLPGQ